MKDFVTFRRMLAPVLVQVIFWGGVLLCIVSGIVTIATRHEWLLGLETLIVGPIFFRLACELIILFFRMNETLTDIHHQLTHVVEKTCKKEDRHEP